ncbi:MAG: glycosyltransferase family 4 protein [archaeon]
MEKQKHSKKKSLGILYMGTFPPRECGIATFTRDLTNAMDKKFSPIIKSRILAMNDNSTATYNYPKNVLLNISDDNISEYIDTAKKINKMDSIKLVNIQHEFGIFGGQCKDYLNAFLDTINKPVVITFHSILPEPDSKLKKVVQCLAKKSSCLVVMTKNAVEILRNDYGIKTPIEVIPHGIPTVSFGSNAKEKKKIGYKNNIILLTFGMLNAGKGCEYVIDALPKLTKKFSNLLYLIVGETHPIVRQNEGEKYRNFLKNKVKELGLQKNVKFYNKYVKLSEIVQYLKAADIYICSNNDPYQAVSGTLAYAMGCGRAVISTPFVHAIEAVNPKRGILVEFNNPHSFENAIMKLLSDPKLKEKMERNAYSYTRHMTWPNIALSNIKVFNKYAGLPKI